LGAEGRDDESDVKGGITMSDEGTRAKLGRIVLWVFTIVFGFLMLLAGANKFMQPDAWVERFQSWGYPGGFAYVIGALEVGGAIGVFVPRLAMYAGGLVATIMCGAAVTLIMNPGTLGPPTIPLMNVIAFTAIAYARRGERRRLGFRGESRTS
jgi:uncharacterized membrane protein YphA (DoxX/SURF4 family)